MLFRLHWYFYRAQKKFRLPFSFILASTTTVSCSLAAAAENTVPSPLPVVLTVRACISNAPLSMVVIVYSPSPLNVNVVLSRVMKCGSPNIKPEMKLSVKNVLGVVGKSNRHRNVDFILVKNYTLNIRRPETIPLDRK